MLNIYNTIEAQTVEEAMTQGGLDFEVEQLPVYTEHKGERIEIPSHKAVVRDDNSVVLSLMGKNYVPIQNSERAKWANELVAAGNAIFKSVGVIGSGEVSWMLAQLPGWMDIGLPEDKLDKYLLFSDSYNGSMQFTTKFTTIRPICLNTFHMAMKQNKGIAGQDQRFKHTSGIFDRINDVREALGLVDAYYANLAESFKKMGQQDMTNDQAVGFFQQLLGVVDTEQEISTRAYNKLGHLTDLFEGDAAGAGVAGSTAWGAFNAVTEFTDHHATFRGDDESKRLHSAWFGNGEKMKQHAFDLLMREVNDSFEFVPVKVKVGKNQELMEMKF
jgi:phage/plasmid-like protein (TIGR03299 family)